MNIDRIRAQMHECNVPDADEELTIVSSDNRFTIVKAGARLYMIDNFQTVTRVGIVERLSYNLTASDLANKVLTFLEKTTKRFAGLVTEYAGTSCISTVYKVEKTYVSPTYAY